MWSRRPLRDAIFRAHVGNLRVSAVVTRETVREAARRWQSPFSARATQLWGEYMAGTAMLSSFFKGDERVKLTLHSPAVQELYVEAVAVGEVRVCLQLRSLRGLVLTVVAFSPQVRGKAVLSSPTPKSHESSSTDGERVHSLPPYRFYTVARTRRVGIKRCTDIAMNYYCLARGADMVGSMQVSKILYGVTKPYETTIRATGIAETDFQTFYDVSEQVPTAVRISSDVSSDHTLCCGVTIQKMPEAVPHGHFYELQDLRFDEHPLHASAIATNDDLLAYLNALIPDAGKLLEQSSRKIPLDFFCRCSKSGFATRLKELGAAELGSVIRDADATGVDLTCHFCNEVYQFPLDELHVLASELKAQ